MMYLAHGGDIYTARIKGDIPLLDFSANINPLGMPEVVQRAAQLAVLEAVHYPDPLGRELKHGIAQQEGLLPSQVILGNGAADLIYRLVLALQPKRASLLAPTFSEYEQALQMVGCHIQYHALIENNDFTLTEAILEELTTDLDMMWLCNPNNPTGRLIPKALLEKILVVCREKQITLVVDECFLELSLQGEQHRLNPCVNQYPELFLLRAFTKSYAMPGLRLGYGLCAKQELLEKMTLCGQPWPVSVVAQQAGLAALQENVFLEKSQTYIDIERKFLQEELEKLNFWVCPGTANYLLWRSEDQRDWQACLAQKGFLIRSCANYRGLSLQYYRIAVRQRQDNEQLILAMKDCLEETQHG